MASEKQKILRESISKDVDSFLKKGGKIEIIEFGVRTLETDEKLMANLFRNYENLEEFENEY